MKRIAAWGVLAAVVAVALIYCAYRTGYVRAYCESRYGADAQTTWTGWAGQNGECLVAPEIPARTEMVP